MMADGHVALRLAGLLGVGGNRVEADEGEEHDRRPEHDARQAVGGNGLRTASSIGVSQRLRPNWPSSPHFAVGSAIMCRSVTAMPVQLWGSTKCQPTKMTNSTTHTLMATSSVFVQAVSRMPRTRTTVTASKISTAGKFSHEAPADVNGSAARISGTPADGDAQKLAEVVRPRSRHRGAAHRVFQDQVPADDPGEQFAEGGVGIGVGAAGNRHGRSKLGIAQRRQSASKTGDEVRHHDRRPGVQGRRASRHHEDACSDDRPDAKRRQRRRPQHARSRLSSCISACSVSSDLRANHCWTLIGMAARQPAGVPCGS